MLRLRKKSKGDQLPSPAHQVSKRLHVSLISHSYSEEGYRAKLEFISKVVDLEVVAPETFPSPFGTVRFKQDNLKGYRARLFKPLFPIGIKTSTRWFLQSWDLGFRRSQPDVIHIENEAHSFIVLQAVLCRALFAKRSKIVLFVWANIAQTGPKAMILNSLARLLRPAMDFYLAGNSDGADLIARSGVGPDRVRVVPQSGIDQNVYRPVARTQRLLQRRKLGIGDREFVVGYVGRLVRAKGIDDLISANNVVMSSEIRAQVRLLVVGDGPERDRLEALAPQVILASPGGVLAVAPYYHAMDVLVLPSRTQAHWKEQFGRVLIEAMSSGVPVIGSESGAIPEVIGNGGLTFPEGDVTQLAAHLAALAEQPALRARLAGQGRKRVLDHYTAEGIAQLTVNAYSDTCSAV